MRVTFYFTAVLLLLVDSASAPRAEDALLALALRSPDERAGEYDALAKAWLEAVPRHAGDPRVEILLRRLTSLRSSIRDEGALLPLVERALEARYESGVVRQMLLDMAADLYRRAGREQDRARVRAGRGFLLHWLVAGPFGLESEAPFLEAYPPESGQTSASKYHAGWRDVSWRPPRRGDPEPLIDPHAWVYPGKGVVYLVTHVESSGETTGVLQRGTSDSMKVWVNGTLVVDDDVHRERLPNRRATGLRLAKGWNRVLVKAQSPFWLRIADPKGDSLPAETLKEDLEGAFHELPAAADPRWEGPFLSGAFASWAKDAADLERKEGVAPRDAADLRMGLAVLAAAYSRDDLAVREAQKAVALVPDDPFLRYHAGVIYRGASYLPANSSKNLAQSAFDAALAKDPGFVPAHERLARFLEADGKPAAAARKAEAALALAPGFLPALDRKRSVFTGRKWLEEEIATLREVEKASPSSPAAAAFWARRYEELENPAKAAEEYHRAFDLDRRSTKLLTSIAGAETAKGDVKAAESAYAEAARLDPDDVPSADRRASFLADLGRFDEAEALARAQIEALPEDPARHVRLGKVLLEAGKKDEARKAFQAALALEPGDASLRRYLVSVEGAASKDAGAKLDEFWRPYDERLEDWVARVPETGPLVEKAAAIVVLDITVARIEADGSSAEYVHQASKVLSAESKEDLAKVDVEGEPVLLRTLTPGGESLEPVPGQGKRHFVMPGIAPGVFVEHASRTERPMRQGPFGGAAFYFQDPSYRQSFLLSRYVLILPPDFDDAIVERQLEGERSGRVELAKVTKTVREQEGGGKVIVYEARDVPRLEEERNMPADMEYLPNVQILEKRTWGEVARATKDVLRARTLPTPELEAAAREATEGLSSPLEKARALYAYVNKLVPSGGGGREAVAVLLEKEGDRNILFKALLDAAGVPSRWAFLRPQEALLARTEWEYPRRELFPFPSLVLDGEGGAPTYVSLSERRTPFGRLAESLAGGKAMVLDEGGARIVHIPAADLDDGAVTFRGSLTLGAASDVAAEFELSLGSVAGYGQKETLRRVPDAQRDQLLRTFAARMFPGAKVEKASFPGLDDDSKPLTFALTLLAPKMLKASKDGALLKAIVQPSGLVSSYAGRAKREHPFHLREQRVVRDRTVVSSGKGYALDRTPSDAVLSCPLGSYSLLYRKEEGATVITRELTLLPGRLTAAEFPDFVRFCERVDAAERESLLFRKTP